MTYLKTKEKNYHTEKTRRLIGELKARGGKFVNFKCEKDVLEKIEGIKLALELRNRQQVLEFLVLNYEPPPSFLPSLYDSK